MMCDQEMEVIIAFCSPLSVCKILDIHGFQGLWVLGGLAEVFCLRFNSGQVPDSAAAH